VLPEHLRNNLAPLIMGHHATYRKRGSTPIGDSYPLPAPTLEDITGLVFAGRLKVEVHSPWKPGAGAAICRWRPIDGDWVTGTTITVLDLLTDITPSLPSGSYELSAAWASYPALLQLSAWAFNPFTVP
jgi:hypothetical protein